MVNLVAEEIWLKQIFLEELPAITYNPLLLLKQDFIFSDAPQDQEICVNYYILGLTDSSFI